MTILLGLLAPLLNVLKGIISDVVIKYLSMPATIMAKTKETEHVFEENPVEPFDSDDLISRSDWLQSVREED